ncbi:MAG: MFS transporter [Firmicutes bacterium]|nr:MFS transporter [Candidatus Colimorpha enterica]
MDELNELGYTPGEDRLFRKNGMKYLLLFSLLYASVYCMRLNIGNATGLMIAEGIINEKQAGILSGLLFWFYGVGQLVSGRISETKSPVTLLTVSVALSAGMNLLFGLQNNFVLMAIIWAVNGFAQSLAWSPGVVALSKWFPGSRRGFSLGFALAFSGFGQALSYIAVAAAFAAFPGLGWRAAFLIPLILPVILLVVFRLFAKNKPEDVGLRSYKEPDPEKSLLETEIKKKVDEGGVFTPFLLVLKTKGFLLWIPFSFLGGLVRYGLCTWVPLYFNQVYGIDPTSGLLQSAILPVGMGFGTFIVPWFTDRFCPNNRLPAAVISAIVAAVSIGVLLGLDPTVPSQLAVIELLLFVTGFAVYAVSGISWAVATDVGGRALSGTASGILNFSSYIGAAVQSVIYGFLLSRIGWRMVFISMIAACVINSLIALIKSLKGKRK